MVKAITPSYYTDINDFADIIVYGRTISQMLGQWDVALSIEERVYENLVRVFYSNIELSVTQTDRVVTQVAGIRIKFDVFELSCILGISYEGLDLYTSKKELCFSEFRHLKAVRNICRRRDLFDDVCS